MIIQLVLGQLVWLCAQTATSYGPALVCDGPYHVYSPVAVVEVVESP